MQISFSWVVHVGDAQSTKSVPNLLYLTAGDYQVLLRCWNSKRRRVILFASIDSILLPTLKLQNFGFCSSSIPPLHFSGTGNSYNPDTRGGDALISLNCNHSFSLYRAKLAQTALDTSNHFSQHSTTWTCVDLSQEEASVKRWIQPRNSPAVMIHNSMYRGYNTGLSPSPLRRDPNRCVHLALVEPLASTICCHHDAAQRFG